MGALGAAHCRLSKGKLRFGSIEETDGGRLLSGTSDGKCETLGLLRDGGRSDEDEWNMDLVDCRAARDWGKTEGVGEGFGNSTGAGAGIVTSLLTMDAASDLIPVPGGGAIKAVFWNWSGKFSFGRYEVGLDAVCGVVGLLK